MKVMTMMPFLFEADTPEKCMDILQRVKAASIVGVDTETTSIDFRKEHPKGKIRCVSLQLAIDDNYVVFVPVYSNDRLLAIFKPWLVDDKPTKVLHNAKFDMHVLMNHGIRMRGLLGDTSVMAFMLDNEQRSYSLKECASRYIGGGKDQSFSEVLSIPKIMKSGRISNKVNRVLTSLEAVDICPEKFKAYACNDAVVTLSLYKCLAEKLAKVPWVGDDNYLKYYTLFELPFTDILLDVERRGCLIDSEFLGRYTPLLDVDIADLAHEILTLSKVCGVPDSFLLEFNPASNKDIGSLISEYLGFSELIMTKSGAISTSAQALKDLSYRTRRKNVANLLDYVLEFRHISKLNSTYLKSLIELAEKYGGRVHTNLRQIGTRTMRLASRSPNLQNIPTAGNDIYGIRKAFVAPAGMVLCDIDLSQIELRLMAHTVADNVMIRALSDGWDLHSLTAVKSEAAVQEWMNKEGRVVSIDTLEDIKKKFPSERRRAKTLNFGVGYGMGKYKYMSSTKVSEKIAEEAINGFFSTYPKLKPGIRAIHRFCHDNGYVRTYLKRYLRVSGIHSSDPSEVASAERRAFNYVIQGSAADLLKMGMILIAQDDRLSSLGVRMIMQVHDELLLEVPDGCEKECAQIITDYVSHPYNYFGTGIFRVDTPSDIGFGKNWAEAK